MEASLDRGYSEVIAYRRSSAAAEVLALMRTTPGWEHGSAAMSDRRLLETAVDAGGAKVSAALAAIGAETTVGDVRAAARLSLMLKMTELNVKEPRTRQLVASAMRRPMDEREGEGAPVTPDGRVFDAFTAVVCSDMFIPGRSGPCVGIALTAEEVAALGLPDAGAMAAAAEAARKEAARKEKEEWVRTKRVRGEPRPETLKAFVPIGESER